MEFISSSIDLIQLAEQKKQEYQNAIPFPNIVFHNFFNETLLNNVLNEFPDLSKLKNIQNFNNHNEKKLATKGESNFGDTTKLLAHFMNSQPLLEFLQTLTGIKEQLIPDPYFVGGGYHEIKPGGVLKIHTDFNKNNNTGLDRRLNLLVYLNKDWEESYGGHFELWDESMSRSFTKILPTFNTVAIFSTTDFSFHGHPNPLTCPPDRSRKSLAFYYYSNGRPQNEVKPETDPNATIFVARKDVKDDVKQTRSAKSIIRDFIPPILLKAIKKS